MLKAAMPDSANEVTRGNSRQQAAQLAPSVTLYRKGFGSGAPAYSTVPGSSTLLDSETQGFFESRLRRQASRTGSNPAGPPIRIAASEDPLESEADRMADRVLRAPQPGASRLRRKPAGASPVAPGALAPPSVHRVLGSPGSALDPESLTFFEQRFQRNLLGVRIHSGEEAAASAEAVGAHAYTIGPHIVFGSGRYSTGSTEGRRLLAHELAHVEQQSCATAHETSPKVQRKEVGSDAEIRGPQDWTAADREGNTDRWKTACQTNLNAIDSSQYVRVMERRDFYKWFYQFAAAKGFSTRWALAAYVVATGAQQIADMDVQHSFGDDFLGMANVELQGAMREGNQIIFDNVLPKLKKLIDGGPLKGPAALQWDMQILAEEQNLVQPMYARLSKETVDQLDYIARKKRFAWLGAKTTGGDKVAGVPGMIQEGTVPAFDQPDIRNVGDRWKYGMELGNKFTPGGTGFDPSKQAMPAVGAGYKDGSELAKVDTRAHLHELDAYLNPNRYSRVGPGSDIKVIVAGLTEFEKQQVLSDRSADGWSYSIQFAQFGFIDESTVAAALPSGPASAQAVAAFLARYKAERARVSASTAPVPLPFGP